jgi:hypothetical protein
MKTLFLKSVVLGAAVLTAAFLLVPFARAEEPPRPMPTGHGGGQPDDGMQPFDPNPSAPNSLTRQFMTYGKDSDGNTIPRKTLRITNNTADTVYPIMRDENSNILKSDPGLGLYDPYDPPKREYRGYIGYERGGKFYFGLQKGESILVSLPLVFWNAGRIAIGTDGKYLTPSGVVNPLRYDPNAHRSIARAETSSGNISDGVVMWYRAEIAKGPTDDSEDQLAEWTVRDHTYLVNDEITRKTHREIPDTQLVTLINYDVSNVDNLYLPLAMAANDVWVVPQRSTGAPPNENRDGWEPGSDPDVYGWVGADNTIAFLQTQIRAFTADDNKLLGKYFKDSKGWPFYNIPNPPNAPKKIPSGANVFAQSPIRGLGVVSSYSTGEWDTDKFMLSSGGAEPRAATIGWAGTPPDGDPPGQPILHLNLAPSEREKIAFLQVGYLVKGVPPDQPPTPNPIQEGTKILEIVDRATGTVKLSKNLVNPSKNCAFTFSRPVDDYVSDAMIRLWYSWAQYYLKHWNDGNPDAPTKETPIIGSLKANTGTLTFTQPHRELVKGMAVKGPGLDDAQTEKGVHQGDALILEIAGDQRSVILSQLANKTSENAEFKVRPPQSLLYTPAKEADPGFPLIGNKFVFGNVPPWHNPYEFSQQVYMIMASMNQIGEPNNDSVSKFMQDIVGANMGFIFNNEAKKVFDAQEIIAMIRDMIKSVLRGVTDFTKFPDEVIDKKHTRWYPDPSERTGDQDFNVFNLDPFVWFVHVKLGFSGYGFSVDDDTADIGAGGASELQLTVTETGGLKNTDPWTIQAPYGPVKKVSCLYSGPAPTNGDTLFQDIKRVSGKVDDPNTPITITAPAGRLLSNGDTVVIENVPDPAGLKANNTFKIGNLTRETFDLFDKETGKMPITSSGACEGGAGKCGRWGYPKHPYIDSGNDLKKVFYRVTGDDALGTFLGTFVSVNDVDRTKKGQFRIWRLGRQKVVHETVGRLLLEDNLTDAEGTPLMAGTYTFTFFGTEEPPRVSGGGGVPPPNLGAIRENIHDEMDRIEDRLHRLQKQHSETKESARKERWLEMRISVLTARLQYPTDEVLQQLEQEIEARQSLGREAWRSFLDQLNTRIVELQNGG